MGLIILVAHIAHHTPNLMSYNATLCISLGLLTNENCYSSTYVAI